MGGWEGYSVNRGEGVEGWKTLRRFFFFRIRILFDLILEFLVGKKDVR